MLLPCYSMYEIKGAQCEFFGRRMTIISVGLIMNLEPL